MHGRAGAWGDQGRLCGVQLLRDIGLTLHAGMAVHHPDATDIPHRLSWDRTIVSCIRQHHVDSSEGRRAH